jgi:hypothetical protein
MPKNDSFLIEYFKQCQERMRHTSDTELKLLQFLLLFIPIIGALMAALYDSTIDRIAFMHLSVGVSVFLILVTYFIDGKIRAEHKTYHDVGQSVKKVWRYFELHELGSYIKDEFIIEQEKVHIDRDKGYGAGKGYIRTLWIVWSITGVMMIVILGLGILKLISECI